MAQPFGQTGTADPIAAEYFTWQSASGDLRVHMHLDAIDGLARDVIERSQGLPVEVGGLLLGHATHGDKSAVWIERYQRIECEHRSGPHFVLAEDEFAALETRAAELARASGDLNVVGFYRSHLRDGFCLDAPDREIIARYFEDAEDLFLLIGPASGALRAQFFTHTGNGEVAPADPEFPFRGRAIASLEPDDPKEKTGRSHPVAAGDRLGRLVPDFIPSPRPPLPEPVLSFMQPPTEDLKHDSRAFLARRWPILVAVLLVGAGAAVFLQQAGHRIASPQPTPVADTAATAYPIGLYVDPSGQNWRISWNLNATAVQAARGGKLFVRDGDDQTPIDLSPADLQKGSYQLQVKGSDVTVRLEVTDATGHLSAESFRLKTVEKAPPHETTQEATPASGRTPPVAIHKEAPVVPSSIRPRIRGRIPIDIRVQIDAQGRVISASPLTKAHSGLETYLAGRAVAAAKQWRYKPARQNGNAVAGTEIIHFNFEK